MKFSEMNNTQIREAKNELIRRLKDTLQPSRIKTLGGGGCSIEGGAFPALYNHRKRELTIWGRGSRYSGASRTVSNLQEAERICIEFFDEYQGGNDQ